MASERDRDGDGGGDHEREYTSRELMVSAAASEIDDGDVAFVGMRLPLIAFQVAVSTHAPRAMSVFESGVIRDDPADGFLHTMCDLPNLDRAVSLTGLTDAMGRLARGDVDVGFLGGAEIDRYGNLNTTRVAAGEGSIRLPGSGGACDIACMADRTVILMPHEPRRFVEAVEYVTSPGYGRDGTLRDPEAGDGTQGPRGGGPSALVTTKATFGFADGELYLRECHPGVEPADVTPDFPWDLRTAPDITGERVETTPEPSAAELELIREFDPDGFWTRE